MGCDIHAFVEHNDEPHNPRSTWEGWGREFHLDRWYHWFGHLAGVRGDASPMIPPRGVPLDIAYACRDAYYGDWWKRKDGEQWIPDADWHTPSWLTGAEWREVIARTVADDTIGGEGRELKALSAALLALEAAGSATRVIFWFDN